MKQVDLVSLRKQRKRWKNIAKRRDESPFEECEKLISSKEPTKQFDEFKELQEMRGKAKAASTP